MIHYTKFLCKNKNANWITFVHGAGGSSTIWYKQIKYFSKKYNLLLLDLSGHGKSKSITLNPFKKKYTFNSITNDILEVIDAEKIKKSHFVGKSQRRNSHFSSYLIFNAFLCKYIAFIFLSKSRHCPSSEPRRLSFFKSKTFALLQNQDTCLCSKSRHSFFETRTHVLLNQDICPFSESSNCPSSKPGRLSFFKIKKLVYFQNQNIVLLQTNKTFVLLQNQDICPFSKSRHCPSSKLRHLSFFKTKTLTFFETKTFVLFQNQDIVLLQN